MLIKVSVAAAALGFLTFMGIVFTMIQIPHSGPMFKWPMMAAVWIMVGGLSLCLYDTRRQRQ